MATNSALQLVGPLAFEITDKKLKRAGLDYWPYLQYKYYKNLKEWESQESLTRAWFFSIKGVHTLYNCKIKPGDLLVFGKRNKRFRQ